MNAWMFEETDWSSPPTKEALARQRQEQLLFLQELCRRIHEGTPKKRDFQKQLARHHFLCV